ncbi:hypothetical protein R1sor_012791 [Riccia sorocarpa]|uniref:Pseudouridine synthase RsuA/RluA-like domain-containing protein n=1 Tax=Riccia sorocarpa TaxID=122646 RepID=A0ABD3I4R6_9MARC
MLMSLALRSCRSINPLLTGSRQRASAPGFGFTRNVICFGNILLGQVTTGSGGGVSLATGKEFIGESISSGCAQNAASDSDSYLYSGVECSLRSPSSQKLDGMHLAEGMLNLNPNGSMSARGGCNEDFEEVDKGVIVPDSEAVIDPRTCSPTLEEKGCMVAGNSNSCTDQVANGIQVQSSVAGLSLQVKEVLRIADAAEVSRESNGSETENSVGGAVSEEVERASKYPVPLTPFSGEAEKAIEYERAMVAEAAMKSRAAISRSDILFEDEWLMVINKPSGIYSEHVLATIPSLLQTTTQEVPDSSSEDGKVMRDEIHIHLANRLDRDTSGVMVITKSKKAAGMMSKIFTTRWVQKSYLALCVARPPEWRHLTVESGHGRSRFGAWRVYAKRDVGRELPGKCIVKDMRTHFVVLAVNKELGALEKDSGSFTISRSWWDESKAEQNLVIAGEEQTRAGVPYASAPLEDTANGINTRGILSKSGDEVIIRAFPFTGRTHQIRLHCQYIGLPLRGDVKYGGPHIWNGVQYDHHALHAETLSFRHPFTSEKLFFVAPLPPWAVDAGVQTLQP